MLKSGVEHVPVILDSQLNNGTNDLDVRDFGEASLLANIGDTSACANLRDRIDYFEGSIEGKSRARAALGETGTGVKMLLREIPLHDICQHPITITFFVKLGSRGRRCLVS